MLRGFCACFILTVLNLLHIINPLKCYYDEIRIFPFVAVLKYQQELFMRRKMPFTVFQYLFSLQRYLRL